MKMLKIDYRITVEMAGSVHSDGDRREAPIHEILKCVGLSEFSYYRRHGDHEEIWYFQVIYRDFYMKLHFSF